MELSDKEYVEMAEKLDAEQCILEETSVINAEYARLLKERKILINDIISENTIEKVVMPLLRMDSDGSGKKITIYINHLFYKATKINSKRNKTKLILLSNKFDVAINEEKKHLNRFINKAYNSLTSNIGYIFTKIKEDKIDEINYYSFDEEE